MQFFFLNIFFPRKILVLSMVITTTTILNCLFLTTVVVNALSSKESLDVSFSWGCCQKKESTFIEEWYSETVEQEQRDQEQQEDEEDVPLSSLSCKNNLFLAMMKTGISRNRVV